MNKENLVKVFEKTVKDLKNGFYTNRKGEEIEFDLNKLKRGSKLYRDEDLSNPVRV